MYSLWTKKGLKYKAKEIQSISGVKKIKITRKISVCIGRGVCVRINGGSSGACRCAIIGGRGHGDARLIRRQFEQGLPFGGPFLVVVDEAVLSVLTHLLPFPAAP